MEERKTERQIVDLPVICCIGEAELRGFLYDLSPSGCMVEVGAPDLVTGDQISIRLGEFGRLRGHVIWRRSVCTGIQFASEIDPQIVASLGFSEPAFDIDCPDLKDRFGRKLPRLSTDRR